MVGGALGADEGGVVCKGDGVDGKGDGLDVGVGGGLRIGLGGEVGGGGDGGSTSTTAIDTAACNFTVMFVLV